MRITMEKEFRRYTLDDFFDDPDFCSWARSERPDLDEYYHPLINEHPEQKILFRRAYKLIRLFEDEKITTDLQRKLQLWDVTKSIYRKQNTPARLYRQIFRYAAVFVFLTTIGSLTYYLISSTSQHNNTSLYSKLDFTETKLLLDNGKEINIKTKQSEIVYDQIGNQININNKPVSKVQNTDGTEMNQLVVSFGRQARIILSDQTEVWLNAGSRLVYPTIFEKDKRKVQLQGEAFFKVSKDKTKPFIVETGNSRIKVLGTSFNVKAYPDEKVEETVLVEGSVSLNIGKRLFGKEVLLKPDQRIVISDISNSYTVSKVEVGNYTSWINGLFVFVDEPLSSVLMRISRYYNIKIKWTEDAEPLRISGKLDLKDDFQRVLNALALISDGSYIHENSVVNFKLNN